MRSCIFGLSSLRRSIAVLLTFVAMFAYIELNYTDRWSGSLQLYHRSVTNTIPFTRDAGNDNQYTTRGVPSATGSEEDSRDDLPTDDELFSSSSVGKSSLKATVGEDLPSLKATVGDDLPSLKATVGDDLPSLKATVGDDLPSLKATVGDDLPTDEYLNAPTMGDVLPLQFDDDTSTDYTATPLMLLFSSWAFSAEKAGVHAAVLRLWAAWPYIQNAVVTGDHVVTQRALQAGWSVQPVTHVHKDCYGPPVLSPMFTQLKTKYRAHFYGFSNSDILFGNGLAETMRFVYEHNAWRTKPLLIVGRRHNVDFINESNIDLRTPSDVRELTKFGKLVIRSTDYFFTNNHFPWPKVPEVSIGRPLVVRAIIGFALKRKIAVLDATKTIEAVHLTTQDGNLASWHKKGVKCNDKIMAKFNWSVPVKIGHCECALLETFRDNGQIKVRHRKANATICS